METPTILAVIESDLHLISRLRHTVETCCGQLKIARSSKEAILYLRGVGVYNDRGKYPLPAVIALDSENIHAADLEVLSWIREGPNYARLPAILLSSIPHHSLHVLCALDPHSFIVDRNKPEEIADAVSHHLVAGDHRFDNPRTPISV